jgi:site-specific recombinase XerD
MATVTIQKRKNKKANSYVITYKDPKTGEKKYYKTLRKHRIAQQEANNLRALLDAGQKPKAKKEKLSALTFHEVSTSLREEWSERLSNKDLAEKTVDDYIIWLNVLEREYGKRLLCDFDTDEILKFRNDIAEKKSKIASNKYLSIFKKVFQHGLELGAVTFDPSASITKLSEKEHERNRFLFPYEIDQLIEVSQQTRAKFYLPAMIYLGAEHGAAKQEILGLKWSKIHFDYGERGLITLFRTKNRKERTDVLMPRTKKALLEWHAHQKWMRHRKKINQVKTDLVFAHLDGSPRKSFNKAWWKVLEIAGIKDFHFHDLRHTFCSNLILSGVGLKEVSEMIGHKDITMTNRYTHITTGHRASMQDLLSDHYRRLSGEHIGNIKPKIHKKST